jgi:hypothetical protein
MASNMDWYDRHCWQCGAPGQPDLKGRVLCSRCRFRLAVGDLVISGSRHGMEWYLTHCWHCEEAEVPADDDLGLCAGCRMELAESRVAS